MRMNLANKLTMFRVVCVPIFAVFAALAVMRHERLWYLLALIVFAIASLTDMLDGKVARKYNMITDFGKFLDPLADKLLTTTAFLYMMKSGVIATEVLVIIICREFLISGIRMLAVGSSKKLVIPANIWGKLKTAFMMISIIFYYGIMGLVGDTSWLPLATSILAWICTGLTLISGVTYIVASKDIIKDSQ